jgi:succinate-acetate transporter protein
MYNVHARGVTVPNAVIGMACFVGGLATFAAGMWGMSLTTFSLKDVID